MDRSLKLSLASLGIRLALAGLFFYAGILKLLDPLAFQSQIDRFQLVPFWMAGLAAVVFPWMEIVSAAGLLTRRLRKGALAWFALMLLLFTAVILISWARGLDVDCGCFGATGGSANYPWYVTRNSLLMISVGLVIWLDRRVTRFP